MSPDEQGTEVHFGAGKSGVRFVPGGTIGSPRRFALFAFVAGMLLTLAWPGAAGDVQPAAAQNEVFCPPPPAGMKFLYEPQLRHPFDNPNESEYTCAYIEDPTPTVNAAGLRLTIRWMTGPPEWESTNVYCHDTLPALRINESTGEMSGYYLDVEWIVNSYFKTVGNISEEVAAAGAIALFEHARALAVPCPGSGASGGDADQDEPATTSPTATAAASPEPTATPTETAEYGVIERDGNLYLISRPGEALSISESDLPEWARDQLATVGAVIPNVGFPDHVAEGDAHVLLGGRPVARVGDLTAHGGTIVEGSETIFINGVPAAVRGGYAVCPMTTGLVPHVGGPINPDCNLEDAAARSEEALRDCLAEYDVAISFTDRAASRGDTVLEVDPEGFEVGDGVMIGSDPEQAETARVAGTGSIVLDRPLSRDYPAGTAVVRVPDEYADRVPAPTTASSGVDEDEDSGSVSVTLLAAGVVVLLATGGGMLAYRRTHS